MKANEILSKIPKSKTVKIPEIIIETPETSADIVENINNSITKSLTGWKLEMFFCLNSISGQMFSLKDAYYYENHFKIKYPDNKNVKAKIRQQIQFLRDLGLIEFLSDGKYRKLWK